MAKKSYIKKVKAYKFKTVGRTFGVLNYGIRKITPANAIKVLNKLEAKNEELLFNNTLKGQRGTLEHMKQQYSIGKERASRLRDYKPRYRTRIKTELRKIEFYTDQILSHINSGNYGSFDKSGFNMYHEMFGIDPKGEGATDSDINKWDSYVEYYFGGDDKAAYENFKGHEEEENIGW